MVKDSNDGDKEADLLCGDSIVNYKTVQSFGHEELIFEMYERILLPTLEKQRRTSVKTAVALGMNMVLMYAVLAGYFWIGAEIIVYYKGAVLPKDVFSAIFILMMGIMNAAGSASSAPDMGRANASVNKVYDILDYESTIDAVADDENVNKVRLDLSKIKG